MSPSPGRPSRSRGSQPRISTWNTAPSRPHSGRRDRAACAPVPEAQAQYRSARGRPPFPWAGASRLPAAEGRAKAVPRSRNTGTQAWGTGVFYFGGSRAGLGLILPAPSARRGPRFDSRAPCAIPGSTMRRERKKMRWICSSMPGPNVRWRWGVVWEEYHRAVQKNHAFGGRGGRGGRGTGRGGRGFANP